MGLGLLLLCARKVMGLGIMVLGLGSARASSRVHRDGAAIRNNQERRPRTSSRQMEKSLNRSLAKGSRGKENPRGNVNNNLFIALTAVLMSVRG